MQSIGFFGPGIALVGLTTASSPMIASAWLTLAVGLKSFTHSGFLVNIQVCCFRKFMWIQCIILLTFYLVLLWCQEIAPQYIGVLHGKDF